MRAFALAALGLMACTDYEVSGLNEANGRPGPEDSADEGDPGGGDPGGDDDEVGEFNSAVSGRVCDPSGEWVAGARVYAPLDVDGDGAVERTVETTTDGDGRFLLEGLPAGTWTIHVEKGSFSTSFEVTVNGGTFEMPDPECLDPGSIEIAVVTGAYDSIENILDHMGFEYDLIDGEWGMDYVSLLQDPARMATYDIIFLNCGVNDIWVLDKANIAANISAYVKAGGSIYTSDWAYFFTESAFPSAIDFVGDDKTSGAAYVGSAGKISATVLDETMQEVLGKATAQLNYDLDAWAVASGTGEGATVLLEGSAKTWSGSINNSPLAVQIKPGGRMVYTSFHNERQLTEDMELLLREIILSL